MGRVRVLAAARSACVRRFACEQEVSHGPADATPPEAVANGAEPFLVVGAIDGGGGQKF